METENLCSQRNLYMDVLNSIIYNSQKVEQLNSPSTDEQIYKNVRDPYSRICLSIKRNKIDVTVWMNLENIGSEGSHTQKDTYYMIPFIKCQNRQIHRNRKQSSGCQGLRGEGSRECLLMSTGFLGVMKIFCN